MEGKNCGWIDIHMDRQRDDQHENTIPHHNMWQGVIEKKISGYQKIFFCRNMKTFDIFEWYNEFGFVILT